MKERFYESIIGSKCGTNRQVGFYKNIIGCRCGTNRQVGFYKIIIGCRCGTNRQVGFYKNIIGSSESSCQSPTSDWWKNHFCAQSNF
jgi:hypothetical protein